MFLNKDVLIFEVKLSNSSYPTYEKNTWYVSPGPVKLGNKNICICLQNEFDSV